MGYTSFLMLNGLVSQKMVSHISIVLRTVVSIFLDAAGIFGIC